MSRPGAIQEAMVDCPTCDGTGKVDCEYRGTIEGGPCWESRECPECNGNKRVRDCNLCTECGEELLVGEGEVCSECIEEAERINPGRAA